MNTPPWTERPHATDRLDDELADRLATCELVQRALWAVEVGGIDLEALPPVPPALPPANDDEGLLELFARAIA